MAHSHSSVGLHYSNPSLLDAIKSALAKQNISIDNVTIDQLAAVDEFHVGGRSATKQLFEQLSLPGEQSLLDVGCVLGGAARFVATQYGHHVTGVDLSADYVTAGNEMNRWTDTSNKVTLTLGDASSLPFSEDTFSGAYMLHVGMNVDDKEALFKEIHRVLSPKSQFAIYDMIDISGGKLTFPLPWASEASNSHLTSLAVYQDALASAGFEIVAINDRQQFAIDFVEHITANVARNGGLPALSLHTLVNHDAKRKFANLFKEIMVGTIAPFELIARKNDNKS